LGRFDCGVGRGTAWSLPRPDAVNSAHNDNRKRGRTQIPDERCSQRPPVSSSPKGAPHALAQRSERPMAPTSCFGLRFGYIDRCTWEATWPRRQWSLVPGHRGQTAMPSNPPSLRCISSASTTPGRGPSGRARPPSIRTPPRHAQRRGWPRRPGAEHDAEGLSVLGDGLVHAAHFPEGVAEVVVGRG
jgi:hypothetical protein